MPKGFFTTICSYANSNLKREKAIIAVEVFRANLFDPQVFITVPGSEALAAKPVAGKAGIICKRSADNFGIFDANYPGISPSTQKLLPGSLSNVQVSML